MNFSKRGVERQLHRLDSRKEQRAHKLYLTITQILVIAAIGILCCAFLLCRGVLNGILASAPQIGNIDVTPKGYSTFVYDSKGNQTAKLVSTDSNRIPVTLDMVPEDLQHAFVAIEDERFYEHPGIDIQGIIRAGIKGITTGSFSEGASTITQQLIKNNVFTGWTHETKAESIKRKIQEQYLALQLEKQMSKDEILINYLNTINLGHNTLGVQAAALRYFGKSVSNLTLSEDAVIASITQNPTQYDPIVYPENNDKRRRVVLSNMLDQGWIDAQEYESALNDKVYDRIKTVDLETNDNKINSYFVDALTQQVLEDLQKAGYSQTQAYSLLYSGGLNIYSTQDPDIQKICDEVTSNPDNFPANTKYYLNWSLTTKAADGTITNYSAEMLKNYYQQKNHGFTLDFNSEEDARKAADEYKKSVVADSDTILGETFYVTPQPQIALTIEDQHTGNVVAMVGGRGTKTANRTLNRCTDTVRQPGSTFKVVSTYAPALDAGGMTLATTQLDAPFRYEDGTPVRNWYGESYRGLCSLRTGIQNSMNIIAVKTLTDITPELGYQYLLLFGFTTLVDHEEINGQVFSDIQQTMALGGLTKGVRNIELNAAYAAIANGGEYLEPKLYTQITDHDGNVILNADDRIKRRVLKETTAWLLTSAMEDVVTKGTGTAVNFGTTPIAGKTGTTSDENDVWFAGYTNYYTATTWTGYDDNTNLTTSAEIGLAKSIWRKCMEKIHENLPSSDFRKPSGIVERTICTASGKLPVKGMCDGSLGKEYFDENTVPKEYCDVHYKGYICEYSGLPATSMCPFKVEGVVTLKESGQKCPHDAAFFAQENADEIIAQQKEEVERKKAQVSSEEALNNANAALERAASNLKQMQDALVAAQQSGNTEQVQQLLQMVKQATDEYNNAVAVQAAAQAAAGEGGSGNSENGGNSGNGGNIGNGGE